MKHSRLSVNLCLATLAALSLFAGCSKTMFERGASDSLHQRECIKHTGAPNCTLDGDRGYDEYKRERKEVVEK